MRNSTHPRDDRSGLTTPFNRASIDVWRERGVVVDGHTRREVAMALGIRVSVNLRSFPDDGSALEYAIDSQRGRRNLTLADQIRCVEALDKTKRSGRPKELASQEANSGKSSVETAKTVGVSRATVERIRAVIAPDTPVEIKEAVKAGVMPLKEGARRAAQHRRESESSGKSRERPKPSRSRQPPSFQ